MKTKNLNIALHLEGLDDESGNIRLDDFLSEVSALRAALAAVDSDLNGRQTVYFRVVDLSHSSPAKIVIEPRVKPALLVKKVATKFRSSPTRVHHSLFDTLTKIRDNRLSKIKVSPQVIDAVSDMVDGLGKSFSSGWIANSNKTIQLNTQFKENLNELIRPQFQSFGSFSGELLSLSLARGKRFYIYPSAGPTSVACMFAADQLEIARENVGKTVRVYGTKSYRAGTGHPYRISSVKRIEALSKPASKQRFVPTEGVNTDIPADELVRKIRDEWE